MMILSIPEGLDEPVPVIHGRPMEPGNDYICTNAFAGVILFAKNRIIKGGKEWLLRYLLNAYSIQFDPFDPSENWNNKDVWMYRGGGYGDLLMLTPLIRELKNRWPDIRLHVACGDQYRDVLNGNGIIGEQLPIPYSRETRIDCLLAFEDTVEGDPRAETLHMAQLFAAQAGITLTDIKPDYFVTEEEMAWVRSHYPNNGLPRIGIQLLASGFYRTYAKMPIVMAELAKKAQVLLFGSPGQIELAEPIPNVINLMSDKLSFRQSAALASTCDVCLSPDSSLVHVCSALKVPCIGLYGPFPSALRISSPLAFSFNGKAPCAPCFFHADTPDQFPAGMPCFEQKKCVALESIDPESVVAKVLEVIHNAPTARIAISQ